jgi:Zn finger protein HypA/HybF involved in hydrogenase expression
MEGAHMKIVERRQSGYLMECDCGRGGQFIQERPALASECPKCGKTGLMADLITKWMVARDSMKLDAAD